MVTVKDSTGKILQVNNFIGSNNKLLQKYGYTRLDEQATPVSPDSAPKAQKKSLNPAAEDNE